MYELKSDTDRLGIRHYGDNVIVHDTCELVDAERISFGYTSELTPGMLSRPQGEDYHRLLHDFANLSIGCPTLQTVAVVHSQWTSSGKPFNSMRRCRTTRGP